MTTTLRAAKTATRNDWGAICWTNGMFFESRKYADLEILDRVGGGDSFGSGLIYGFLSGGGAQRAVDLGAAHGALAMTTPGDTSMATLAEVEKLGKVVARACRGNSERAQRGKRAQREEGFGSPFPSPRAAGRVCPTERGG